MNMSMRRGAGLLAALVVLGMLGMPAVAQEPGDAAAGAALAVELRPAVVKAGGPLIVAAEYVTAEPPPAETVTVQRAETATAERGKPAVAFTVDYGDGSAVEELSLLGGGRGAKSKARGMHRYAQEGTYEVTVSATVDGGTPLVETSTVLVGRGAARLQGGSRIETATRIAREDFPTDGAAGAVLLARSDGFADALAAASMAVLEQAPVLLSDSAEVPPAVLEEITRALGDSGRVYLLGGRAALAPSVADALTDAGYDVQRIAGDDRIDTAVQIARFLVDAGVDVDEVVVAGAGGFADALAGAAFAAEAGAPVLLTGADGLDPRVEGVLSELGDVRVLVAGGTRAVSETVVDQLQAPGLEVVRLAGADRFATSASVAEALFDDATAVVVATGANFPDALAGAASAGRLRAPVLLVGRELSPAVADYLQARAGQIEVVYVLGGPAAVSQEVMAEVQALLGLPG